MRWIFVFLVFLNIFFYLWQQHQIKNLSITTKITAPSISNNTNTIKLLSEQPSSAIVRKPTTEANDNIMDPENIDLLAENQHIIKPSTCLYLGGVTKPEQLSIINPYLQQIDNSTLLPTIEQKTSPRFHLYLNFNNPEEQAKALEKLDSAQITYLKITRGPLTGNISLGLFIDQNSYQTILNKLKDLQLSAQIISLPKTAKSYWVEIPPQIHALFTTEVLADLVKRIPTMQQELMLCIQGNNIKD